jgi:four helix bundle protein
MIENYEDLVVWQRADQLAFRVFDLSDGFPRAYVYDLTSQLRRAALSVPTNIAEGCASPHTK